MKIKKQNKKPNENQKQKKELGVIKDNAQSRRKRRATPAPRSPNPRVLGERERPVCVHGRAAGGQLLRVRSVVLAGLKAQL